MTVYHYDQNGKYLGPSELNKTDICPITGEYLIPAWATTIMPPAIPDGMEVYFINGNWELRDLPADQTTETAI